MPQLTLTHVVRADGKVNVWFGRNGLRFDSAAEAAEWARMSEDDLTSIQRLLARVAVAKGLIPGGAGGVVNLTMVFDPAADQPIVFTQGGA